MLYLGGDQGWTRKELVATALGDPVRKPGEASGPERQRASTTASPATRRRSTAELGKRIFDMKVEYAVAQIRRLLAPAAQ